MSQTKEKPEVPVKRVPPTPAEIEAMTRRVLARFTRIMAKLAV